MPCIATTSQRTRSARRSSSIRRWISKTSVSPIEGEITAVYYTDDRARVEWLVPRMKELQADDRSALPDRINRVTSMSRDGKKMLVWTGSASDPGVYYYFDSDAGVDEPARASRTTR